MRLPQVSPPGRQEGENHPQHTPHSLPHTHSAVSAGGPSFHSTKVGQAQALGPDLAQGQTGGIKVRA